MIGGSRATFASRCSALELLPWHRNTSASRVANRGEWRSVSLRTEEKSMSTKDYVAVAAHLAASRYTWKNALGSASVLNDVTARLADVFEADNPSFDRRRFYVAAGYWTEEEGR
jgi:hypothetical protein